MQSDFALHKVTLPRKGIFATAALRGRSESDDWTQAHYRWLEEQQFGQSVQQIVFQEYVDTVKALSKRVDGLDTQLESAASESVFWPVIEGLMALRGVNLLTAMTVVAEIGDLKRFASAPQLIAYFGLRAIPAFMCISRRPQRRGSIRSNVGLPRSLKAIFDAALIVRHDNSSAIRYYLDGYNANPRPFLWSKSADDILASLERFCVRVQKAEGRAL